MDGKEETKAKSEVCPCVFWRIPRAKEDSDDFTVHLKQIPKTFEFPMKSGHQFVLKAYYLEARSSIVQPSAAAKENLPCRTILRREFDKVDYSRILCMMWWPSRLFEPQRVYHILLLSKHLVLF